MTKVAFFATTKHDSSIFGREYLLRAMMVWPDLCWLPGLTFYFMSSVEKKQMLMEKQSNS